MHCQQKKNDGKKKLIIYFRQIHKFLFFRTFSSSTFNSDSVAENLSFSEGSCSIQAASSHNSNYSYVSLQLFVHNIFANYTFFLAQMTDSGKKKEDAVAVYVRTVAEKMDKLIEQQANKGRPKEPKIKTGLEVMLQNLGRMLAKLPEDKERLNMQFTSITYEEIRKEVEKNKS